MTFLVRPRVNVEGVPSDVAKGIDGHLPDVVLTAVLALTELGAPSLNLQVGTGNCFIKGYHVNISAAETLAMAINETASVYIQLSRNGNSEVTGAVVGRTTGALPSDSMLIATVVTNGTEITTITSQQRLKSDDGMIYIPESASAPANQEVTEDALFYVVDNDANNQKAAYKLWANGAIQEIIIW